MSAHPNSFPTTIWPALAQKVSRSPHAAATALATQVNAGIVYAVHYSPEGVRMASAPMPGPTISDLAMAAIVPLERLPRSVQHDLADARMLHLHRRLGGWASSAVSA